MTNNGTNLYLSKLQIVAPVVLILPMVFFGMFSVKSYIENVPVSIIAGIGSIIFFIALAEQLWFIYFLIRKRPAIVLTKNCLIDKLSSRQIAWAEINEITYCSNGFRTPGNHILITSKNSEASIRIRNKLAKINAGRAMKSNDLLRILVQFHKKYGNKS